MRYFAGKKTMKINEMPMDERPRERMMRHGARALGNAELLAVILSTGTRRMNVVEVARSLLSHAGGSLAELSEMNTEGMWKVPGIGRSKALQIAAAVEIARRIAEEKVSGCAIIRSPQDAYMNFAPLYRSQRSEESWCLFLKNNRKVIGSMQVSSGGESMTVINNRAILRKALDLGAKALILSHNHPSGDPNPSSEDVRATENLDNALKSMEIALMDHIILCEDSFFSFAQNEKYSASGKKCKKM